MKPILFILLSLLLIPPARSQQYPAYTARQLMARVQQQDTVYIVNFWATWCAPCIKELPSFDTLERQYAGKPVKVLLVSFDFKEDYEEKLSLFIARKKPLPEIVWFGESDANRFIPVIDDRWSGALPATMVVRGLKKEFMERTVHAAEISRIVAGWPD